MNHLVFVYGTLRKHEPNHYLLSHKNRIAAQTRTRGKLVDTELGYPAIITDDREWTFGELYEVDEDLLTRLDQLEDYFGEGKDNLYDRITAPVFTDRGSCQAYVYVAGTLLTDLKKIIPGGDWTVDRLLKQQTEMLYFAYGSCMDTQRFKEASVDHFFRGVIGQGILRDYRIGFTRHLDDGGRADIIEAAGHRVEGKVYRIKRAALDYLYQREGANDGRYRPTVVDVTINGVLHEQVLTFTVVDKQEDIAPPAHYEAEIRRGGEDVLSPGYVRRLDRLIERLRGRDVK